MRHTFIYLLFQQRLANDNITTSLMLTTFTKCQLSECVRVCVRVCVIFSTSYQHDILQTAFGNFTKFTTSVQLATKMNLLDFEINRS